jgi:DNA-binding transcriptional LysR family regulator
MQLGQIEAFLEVARLGNVRRAARQLSLTQPSLSARLHGLEAAVGDRLFVRTSHGVRLTESGRAFLPYAERALRALREGQGVVRGLRDASSGRLTLGSAPATSTYLLPPLLRDFASAHPRVEIVVRTGHSEEVLALVLNEEVQVGLVRALSHPDIARLPYHEYELVLDTAPGHPLARRQDVTMQEVGQAGLVYFDRTSSYFELTRALFVDAGVAPRPAMELDNIEAAKKMVEEGLGVALLPRMSVERELRLGILAQPQLRGTRLPRRPLIAIWRADVDLPGVARAFLQLAPVQPQARAAAEPRPRGAQAAAR